MHWAAAVDNHIAAYIFVLYRWFHMLAQRHGDQRGQNRCRGGIILLCGGKHLAHRRFQNMAVCSISTLDKRKRIDRKPLRLFLLRNPFLPFVIETFKAQFQCRFYRPVYTKIMAQHRGKEGKAASAVTDCVAPFKGNGVLIITYLP